MALGYKFFSLQKHGRNYKTALTLDDRSTNILPMKTQTKEKILEHGARLVYKKGFNHTGIGEILKAAQVPKGSFYHYFPSKDDFGLELLDFFAVMAASIGLAGLYDQSLSPLNRLKTYFQAYIDNYEKFSFKGGCPIGNLCLEMSDQNPAFRDKLTGILEQMQSAVAKVLEEARDQGDVPQDLAVEDTAHFIVSAWEGSILQMKAMKSKRPLEVFNRMVFEQLLTKWK